MDVYREIPLSVVHRGYIYDFDIFMRLQDTYRLFAAKGVPLTKIHLNMMSPTETRLFVHESQWELAKYEIEQNIRFMLMDPRIDSKHKADLMYSMAIESINYAYKGILPMAVVDVQEDVNEQVKIILSDEAVLGHLGAMNSTDGPMYQHSLRVGIYATALLLKLMGTQLTKAQIRRISMGFFLHDIGMDRIPMEILNKPGRLDDLEWKQVKMHPVWGQRRIITAGTLSPEAINIVLSHHEHIDGSGYPNKKKRDDIPLYARICAIADAFEALTSERPYRKHMEPFEALQVMYQDVHRGLDPDLFNAFVKFLGPET